MWSSGERFYKAVLKADLMGFREIGRSTKGSKQPYLFYFKDPKYEIVFVEKKLMRKPRRY
jgi:hypothetical protein